MTMPNYTMKELLEAGIHFGHQLNRWNPKMESYLFGERNGIHIIDLQQTYPLISNALKVTLLFGDPQIKSCLPTGSFDKSLQCSQSSK